MEKKLMGARCLGWGEVITINGSVRALQRNTAGRICAYVRVYMYAYMYVCVYVYLSTYIMLCLF